MAGSLWSEKEKKFLKDNWHRIKYFEIAAALGRSKKSVQGKAIGMGLGKQNLTAAQYDSNSKPLNLKCCSYKRALPESEWPKARIFLRVIATTKRIAEEHGIVPKVDLSAMRGVFQRTEEVECRNWI